MWFGYLAIGAIGLWVCITTGSFWWVIAFLVFFAVWGIIHAMVNLYNRYNNE